MIYTASQLPEISGYTITEQIYFGSRTAVYRAVDNNQQLPVVIKVLQREYPTFGELVQFRNQYAIAKNLPIAGIVQPLSLETFGNGYALVMADWGGISLEKYIQQQQLDFTEKLAIAIQLADILHELHSSRVIHKDIKPANILIHPESKQVKLIDFSIASLLPKETQEIQNPNVLEGTLAYLAPEQTGRMNRGIDYRSDFYAFGVTLYQLVTGRLPFVTDDPLEMVHCHIAKITTPIHQVNTDVPSMVGAIVAKLMAKNAEDRYQSALGIKHDLAECLSQWKETGLITEFELAQRDLCDRFLIPEKLYGREKEVQTLLDAFERVAQGKSELMLVTGFSGIGKTAVVNEVHKPITRQKGYFIKGKFDQFNRNIPFSAFVQAFRDLMRQLLSESDSQIQEWKNKILNAVGKNGQVIIDVIPELEKIIGEQPPAIDLSGSATANRFNSLFQKFIQVFNSKGYPLVIFLDDLQWADSASIKLIQLLMIDTKYLFLIGAYRDNEVDGAHPLILTINDIKKTAATINTIKLAPLEQIQINWLVADTLRCPEKLAINLSNLVFQKTQGNPFFATQFLKSLYQDKLIKFNFELVCWECDVTEVTRQAVTDNVVTFMICQLQKLPASTQKILQLAACIGNQFDLETLAIVFRETEIETAACLWKALEEGFILPISEVYKFYQGENNNNSVLLDKNQNKRIAKYRFLHDRVQQAAYHMVAENERKETHLEIGQLLLNDFQQKSTIKTIDECIFEIVNHLNIGLELIKNPEEKHHLIELNFIAGKKAKKSTAYVVAYKYAEIACNLLPSNYWLTDYKSALSIHELAAEAAYLSGNISHAEAVVDILLERSINSLDKLKAYEIIIQILISKNQLIKAIEISQAFLLILDINIPINPIEDDIDIALAHIYNQLRLNQFQIESLVTLPIMQDKKHLAAMRILSAILNAAYLGLPNLLPIIVAKQVNLSLQYGHTEVSPSAYANYGLILCGITCDYELGYRFGNLALNLLYQIDSKEFYAKTIEIVCLAIKHWQEHVNSTINLLKEAYKFGIESGDLESASFAAFDYCNHSFVIGNNLIDLEQEMSNYGYTIDKYQQRMISNLIAMYRQLVINLIYVNKNPCLLKGEVYNEEVMLPIYIEDNDYSSLALFYIQKIFICYLFGDSRQAIVMANQARLYLEGIPGQVSVPLFYLYNALSWLSLYSVLDEKERKQVFESVEECHNKMKIWATHAPMNFQHKYDLVEAEKCRVLGQKLEAIELYDKAIAGAKANEYLQEEALANELVAKFYLNWGKEKVAAVYMQEAYYCYARWGAKAKINDLEKRYPNLLRPILQSAEVSSGTWNTLMTISPTASVHSSTHKSSSSTSINQALDFAAILKSSQALSSAIEIEELLYQLTQIILQNSGGDRCALILPNEAGEWQVRAIATPDDTQLCDQPLANNPNLPVKLIQYVKNTLETVVINELKTDLPVIDDYLRQRQPKSLLCLPLLNQGQIIGILYLKNRFTIGAFTNERVAVLNFLTIQATISLENARLYQKAQEYAQQLEQSQLQIVQSEKMASLGNLVAGVAHEINNPIGFLNGSISNGKDYVQDLFEYLEVYHQQQPPSDEVEKLAEEIDLEYLLEDLPKLLESMQGATDRITNISTSLRTFSRADTDHKVTANLHEGIDSTLLILKYRLKANDCRPAIQITKDYGDLPTIECFPGQLNQVFMNILANGIDMFDEMAQTHSYQNLEANPQQIHIRTQIESNQVYIRIRDNGKGMSEDVQAKIFDNLFTTKEVSKGTGLGLAIARQIVVEKHGGSLNVWSEPGQGTEFCISLPIGRKS